MDPTAGRPEGAATRYRYLFGAVEFDEAQLELRVAGERVNLEQRPIQLLAALLRLPGEVVTREELFETVWAGRPTVDNVLANAVAKLRKALGLENARYIVTLPRVGYCFTGKLERIAVGRALTSKLRLVRGDAVPGREHFLLEALISSSLGNEVWTGRHDKTHELRVDKFSPGGERLALLKREATLYRVLRGSLGDRADCARIIDWNFEAPPFFLECEYGGQNLLDWAETDGRLAALTLQERLALFLQIADAVVAAHSVGVLHKDLKPANVLVLARDTQSAEAGWQARLTDFGSGLLLDPDRLADMGITRMGLTQTQTVFANTTGGTPLYLAPELIAGQMPTVQSDLFALGILLYQLIVANLRKPMMPGWERDIPDELLHDDVAAATDGDRARRLANVTELVGRLRTLEQRRQAQVRAIAAQTAAHVAHEALQLSRARRPWVAASMVALAIGCGVSLWLYRGARQATARTEAVSDFLNEDVLADTGALKTDTDPDPTMRRVLKNAAARVGERFTDDPASEGRIRLAIGQGLSGLGDYAAAEEQERLAVQRLERAFGPTADTTLDASYTLAGLLLEQSKFQQAEAAPAELDRVGSRPRVDSVIAMKGRALRGMLRATRKDCERALTDFRAADQLMRGTDDAAACNRYNIRSWVGQSLNCLGRHDAALKVFAALLGQQNDKAAIGPALNAYARLGYAEALQYTAGAGAAETQFVRALKQLEASVREKDALTLGQALVQVGNFCLRSGRFEAAGADLTRGRTLLVTIGAQQEMGLVALAKGYSDSTIASARYTIAVSTSGGGSGGGSDVNGSHGGGGAISIANLIGLLGLVLWKCWRRGTVSRPCHCA